MKDGAYPAKDKTYTTQGTTDWAKDKIYPTQDAADRITDESQIYYTH